MPTRLDLTQEQQTKLEAIFEAQKTQMKALRGDDKEARKAQRKAQKRKWMLYLAHQHLTKTLQKSY
ncbi:hypothetical protein P4S68_17550 [Pseudoalteromonas sp. Hal099]